MHHMRAGTADVSRMPQANAEKIQGNLDMKLPGFDVEVNARSFESAFIFYNTWTATAGA